MSNKIVLKMPDGSTRVLKKESETPFSFSVGSSPATGYIGTVEAVERGTAFFVKMKDGPTFELPETIEWIEPGCRIRFDYLNLTVELLSPPA